MTEENYLSLKNYPELYDKGHHNYKDTDLKAVQSLNTLNDQIAHFMVNRPKALDDEDDTFLPSEKETLKKSMTLMRQLLMDAQAQLTATTPVLTWVSEDEHTLSSEACAVSRPLLYTLQTHHAASAELQHWRTMQIWAAYRQARRRPARLQGLLGQLCTAPWKLPSMVGSGIAWTQTGNV
ncbi:UNVERIFIED_CONTAM: hypothetical protein FKN15_025307 [Acipenser sinensis]